MKKVKIHLNRNSHKDSVMYINAHGEFEFWRDPYYHAYIEKYGHHFSPKLAEYASANMINRDGTSHSWTRAEIVLALDKAEVKLPPHIKVCDFMYIANKKYAKYYGSSATTEKEIIAQALDSANYEGNHEGKQFNHYLTDAMTLGHAINFADMM